MNDFRIVQLEIEVRRLKRLVGALILVVGSSLFVGAVALKDEAIRGKLSILNDAGEPKIVLSPDGKMDVGDKLVVKGIDILDELAKQPGLAGKIATTSEDIKQLKECCLRYTIIEIVYNVNLDFPVKPGTRTFTYGPWGSKVVGAWWEPVDGIAGMNFIDEINCAPSGNSISVLIKKPVAGGAFFRLRYHILYSP